MKIQKNLDWLIVFYISHVRQSVREIQALMQLIDQCRMNTHSEVWVLYEKVHPDFERSKATFQLTVYRLEVQDNQSALKEVPLTFFGVGQSTKASWKNVLTYLYQQLVSQRRILFTWSHGAGFGIHAQEAALNAEGFTYQVLDKDTGAGITEVTDAYQYLTREEVEQVNNSHAAPLISPVKLLTDEYQMVKKEDVFDCSKADILWMSDLSQFLKEVLGGRKIDLLVMMNCNMQLFENGYMMRDVVSVLIGPETKMWAYGYDYKNVLQLISADPGTETRALAKSIVNDYIAMHKKLGHHAYLNKNIMLANHLEKYERMAGLLQETTGYFLERWEALRSTLERVRQQYFYSVSGREVLFLVDFKLWMDIIYQLPELGLPHHQRYQEFLEDVRDTVIAKHIGASFIEDDKTGPPYYGPAFAGLFFPVKDGFSLPTKRYVWCEYFSGQRSSPFQQATLWDEFIKAFAT